MDYTVKFLRSERVASDAYSFYFERPVDFNFLPGQYLKLTLEIPVPDERSDHRLFTICSSPTEKDYLMITTRIIQSAFKKTLVDLAADSPVKVSGPFGVFILKESEVRPHIFLAGGIGITPYRSMIKYCVDKNLTIPITLFTSFRTTEDVVFSDMFKQIAATHSWLTLVETITRPEESKTPWNGLAGRIDANLLKSYGPKVPTSSLFYISGPPTMVDGLSETVKSFGVVPENIRAEKFTGY